MQTSPRSWSATAVIAGLLLLGVFSLSRTAGRSGLPPGGDFTLRSADGPLALRDLRGKAVLLFFGYTECPGVCPTALFDHAAAFRQLRAEELDRVAGLFVSVDPDRDTPARLREYANAFHPRIRGVTGTPADLQDVARRYGVIYSRQAPDRTGQYGVDHSSETFVIAPDGRLAARLPFGTPPEAIVAELRRWLR